MRSLLSFVADCGNQEEVSCTNILSGMEPMSLQTQANVKNPRRGGGAYASFFFFLEMMASRFMCREGSLSLGDNIGKHHS